MIRELIQKAFLERNRDLLLIYGIAHFLTKYNFNQREALEIVRNELFSPNGIIRYVKIPVNFVRNFLKRLKQTFYYDIWRRKPEKERKVVILCHLVPLREEVAPENPNSTAIIFRDGTKITIREYRKLILEAFEHFGRIALTDFELMGFFKTEKGYNFERALIIVNSIGVLLDMIDLTFIKI